MQPPKDLQLPKSNLKPVKNDLKPLKNKLKPLKNKLKPLRSNLKPAGKKLTRCWLSRSAIGRSGRGSSFVFNGRRSATPQTNHPGIRSSCPGSKQRCSSGGGGRSLYWSPPSLSSAPWLAGLNDVPAGLLAIRLRACFRRKSDWSPVCTASLPSISLGRRL